MPRATTTGQETERFDLKSCPGGYVVIRKMAYGEVMKRQAIISKIDVLARSKRQRSRNKDNDIFGQMSLANEKITRLDFSCVVDHNLEDETGRTLDFSNPMDLSRLDPRVGNEVGDYINRVNNFDLDEEEEDSEEPGTLGNSQSESTIASSED